MSSCNLKEMREQIRSYLSGNQRYDFTKHKDYAKYIMLCAMENDYDIEAFLATPKIYQFRPDLFDVKVVSMILLKAMMVLPRTDLNLCKYMIAPDRLNKEPISNIVSLGYCLEQCKFEQFWNDLQSIEETVNLVTGFREGIQNSGVLYITYQSISKDLLVRLLDMQRNTEELEAFAQRQGWKVGDDTVIIRDHVERLRNVTVKRSAECKLDAISECFPSH